MNLRKSVSIPAARHVGVLGRLARDRPRVSTPMVVDKSERDAVSLVPRVGSEEIIIESTAIYSVQTFIPGGAEVFT